MADWHFGGDRQSAEIPPQGDDGIQRAAAWVICLTAAIGGAWLLFRYAWGALLPFVLAYLLGRCIRPLVTRAVGKSKLPRGVVAAVGVILPVGVLVILTVWGIERAVAELEDLLTHWETSAGGPGQVLTSVGDWMRSVSDHIPFLRRFENTPAFESFCNGLDTLVRRAAESALTTLGDRVSAVVVGAVTRMPAAILFVTVLLLSCYYVAADDGSMERALGRRLMSWLPPTWRERLPILRCRGRRTLVGYLRAYTILGGITFLEMFIGLSVLRVPYAFLGALAIALVDILPVLGAGAVLIPWAVVQFILGETGLGVGLLVLWGVSTLLRQVIEPRLVSVTLGIHPLLSLIAMYVGLHLFGFWGMLLCPLAVTVIKTALGSSAGEEEKKSSG